jgi:hypothetical protein
VVWCIRDDCWISSSAAFLAAFAELRFEPVQSCQETGEWGLGGDIAAMGDIGILT